MKTWFPLNDYDFYAYITSGIILIVGFDYALGGQVLINKPEWRVVDGVFWAAMSYLIGHIVSGLSEPFLQRFVTHSLLRSPVQVILGLKVKRYRELFFSRLFAREYSPFPKSVQEGIIAKIVSSLKVKDISTVKSEEIYHIAFSGAYHNSNSNSRIDQFQNLFGMCRNVSFSALFSAILIAINVGFRGNSHANFVLFSAFVLGIGMFGRFLKFYSAYTREVLRSFNKD
jgi:hypothetical protein